MADFIKESGEPDLFTFLTFKEWLLTEDYKSKEWIVVAQNNITMNGKYPIIEFYTFSALAANIANNHEKILANSTWDVHPGFGLPEFYHIPRDNKIVFDPGFTKEKRGIIFKPFIIHQEFNDFVPEVNKIIDHFILFHNAFFNQKKNEYQRIDSNGDIFSVIKLEKEGENWTIKVDAHHLRDYLAAVNCLLIRYHDHRLMVRRDITDFLENRYKKMQWKTETTAFELILQTNIPWDNYITRSFLRGKDLIFAYKKPDKRHTSFINYDKNKKYLKFIIDIDDQGELIEETCNRKVLGNRFLTSTFFKKEVLLKYYQQPQLYNVSNYFVSCLNLWSIRTTINEEGLVHVWLGDLGHLPYKEQLHWKQYNVPPRGSITEERFQSDLMAKFIEPKDDPVYYFNQKFQKLQEITHKSLGEKIFLELKNGDIDLYKTLRIPLTEETKEMDEQVQTLAKILPDSINVSLLKKQTGKTIDNVSIKGSIDLLEELLKFKKLSETDITIIIQSFRKIQNLRSAAAAHRKGSNYQKLLKNYNLNGLPNSKKIKKLLEETNQIIDSLIKIFE